MNILPLAILILSATGEARREMVVDQEISGIVARVVWGAVSDAIGNKRGTVGISGVTGVQLTIDNQPRTGWRAWAEAAVRVGAYAGDFRADGSVGLAYRLQIKKYAIYTSTSVSDGNVIKTVDAWWTEVVPVGRSTRRIPIHVTIILRATEADGATRIVGVARGTADTSDFACRIVRRFAEREAAATLERELGRVLLAAERKGTDLYRGADEYTDLLDGLGNGVRGMNIGRLRR